MHWRHLSIGLLFCLVARVEAQQVPIDSVNLADSTSRHAVRLRDGSTLTGRIVSVSADSVRLRLSSGEMSLGRNAIVSVRSLSAERFRNGKYWFENPHATRLLLSSTAIPMEKGTGYYSNTWLVLHTFATGVTDRFTLGGGLAWYPGVGLDETFYYFMPKYTVVNQDRVKLAVGALASLIPQGGGASDVPASIGVLYGVGTLGSRDSNLSLGAGWGYQGNDFGQNPLVMIGGQHRMSQRVSFISENWIVPLDGETEGLYSFGLRFLGEGITVDLAYASAIGESVWIPWLGFAFKF